jgi:hypothetical protein
VSHVDVGSEPDPWFGQQRNAFLRFRLKLLAGAGANLPAAPTVELRGQRIEGSVRTGDVIEVPGPWKPGHRPKYVLNVTTGEPVKSLRGSRTAMWVILIVCLSAILAFMVFVFSNVFGDWNPPF